MADRVILTGPTASGKGGAAHELARRLGGEVILVDSMKIYREMDIGTAKPSRARREEVPYHIVDIADPAEEFNVGEYLRRALQAVDEIEGRGRKVVFCGGTALYLLALLEGLFIGPEADWEVRRGLIEEAQRAGLADLHRRLAIEDPDAAAKIHPNDERRIVRALEVRRLTGRKLTELWRESAVRLDPGTHRLVGLRWKRDDLYRRINARVLAMVEWGLFDEARRLRNRPGGVGRAASQCIGYKEIFAGDDREQPAAEVIEAIQKRTRRFAKQQCTWFRRFPVEWIDVNGSLGPAEIAERILASKPG